MLTYKTPPTAAAATIYRTHTLTNLPFATRFTLEHFCFISHLHHLITSHGINFIYFTLLLLFIMDSNPELTWRSYLQLIRTRTATGKRTFCYFSKKLTKDFYLFRTKYHSFYLICSIYYASHPQ